MDTYGDAGHVLLTTVRWFTEKPLIYLLHAKASASTSTQWPVTYQYIPTKTTLVDDVTTVLIISTPTTALAAEPEFRVKLAQLEQQYHELRSKKTDLEWSYEYIQSDLSDCQYLREYWAQQYWDVLPENMKIKLQCDKYDEQRCELRGKAFVLRDKLNAALTDVGTLDRPILELKDTIQQLTSYTTDVDNQANAVTQVYATQLVALRFQIKQLTSRNSKPELANSSWRTFTEGNQSKKEFDDLTLRLRERSRQVREMQERAAALEHCIMNWPTTITDDSSQLKMDELQTQLENQQKAIESLKQQVSTRPRGVKAYNECRDRCNVHSENLKKNYGLHYPVMLEKIELAHRHLNFVPGTISHSDFDRPANKASCYTTEDYEPYDTDGLFATQSLKPVVRVPNSTSVQKVADAAPPSHAIVYPATRWTAFGQKRKDDQAKKRGEAGPNEANEDPEAVEPNWHGTLPALNDLADVTSQQPADGAAQAHEDHAEPPDSKNKNVALPGPINLTDTAVPTLEPLPTPTEDATLPILRPQANAFTPAHRMPVLVPKKAAGLEASMWASADDGPCAGHSGASAFNQKHSAGSGGGTEDSGTL
ncbi:hypothetical protein LTR78_005464 [Recurvomyces mirabilis]|uniref:Uncharacterized protein n=1 Tax=Recurvomyces mirabilis TaxID=574656 RepID=A0AAE1C1T4_9PEZI|nr:hypothetical protein LTR78_005464 [Recurvomyces mirabilis]KAK5152628.1 hypothetical protein LTS14_008162 [Recurvomyces mirabilis]